MKLTPEEAKKIADDFESLANNGKLMSKNEKELKEMEDNFKNSPLGDLFKSFDKK